ncbi:hypothetical protein [Gloeothece verrucosa]|uniref:Uncharacterized protein n=1 Tax=Gloeothece verrucosa (strain PCC 7822) TaxID=497965 RepID=E0UD69_GLOV7|nr:hypothetical protein [Gloeothece verrucosa]ADN12949.1 hypothetical protein Cyan7822_0935 [Gloeothece verrucosa PCC 7822]
MNSQTQETSPKNAATEERLAKLTGFNSPSAGSSESKTPSSTHSPLLTDEDLEEQITRHSFASSPLSKLVFVAGVVFFVVFVASLFLSQFQSPGESVSAKKPNETKESQQSPLLSPENQDKEKSELLSELALREQQERLKDLEAEKVKQPQPIKQDPRTGQPQPKTVTLPQKRPVQSVPIRQTPIRQTPVRPVVYQPRPQPVPVRYGQPVRSIPAVRATVSPSRSNLVDPSQVWTQLAQVGSFGGVSSQSRISNRSMPRYEPKTASTPVVPNIRATETPVPENSSNSTNYNPSSPAVAFGQSVSAVLDTTIAWESSRNSTTEVAPDDRYIITLDEPLKDKSGNVLIRAGSQLVVKLSAGNNALVTLIAESLMVDGVETKLPQGALKIRGVKGQPLIASRKTFGGSNGNSAEALTDILSVAGDFADIPGTRSLSTLYRGITGGKTRRSGVTATVLYLKAGTPLEVFVNKSFNLDVPEKPLELDLSGLTSVEGGAGND